MRQWLTSFKNSFLHLVYPKHCLHCEELMQPDQPLFCSVCAQQLELIDPQERCPSCFSSDYDAEARYCALCREKPALFQAMASAFDYIGPPASLIKKMKYADQPHLAPGAAAFLVAQLERLAWPLPDALVPVPLSFTHWLARGYNQSELLAHHMGEFLKIPVWNALKRESGDYSQAGLNMAQRKSLRSGCFKRKERYALEDKTLLLIDDVLTTGSTLQRCAEALLEGWPGPLYALTVCRTIIDTPSSSKLEGV